MLAAQPPRIRHTAVPGLPSAPLCAARATPGTPTDQRPPLPIPGHRGARSLIPGKATRPPDSRCISREQPNRKADPHGLVSNEPPWVCPAAPRRLPTENSLMTPLPLGSPTSHTGTVTASNQGGGGKRERLSGAFRLHEQKLTCVCAGDSAVPVPSPTDPDITPKGNC